MSEKPIMILDPRGHITCPHCNNQTLPRFTGVEMAVKCKNPECGKVVEREDSKQQTIVNAPYLCPACKKPANQIEAQANGPFMIFYHKSEGCMTIINVQLIALPQMPQSRIVVPGRPS